MPVEVKFEVKVVTPVVEAGTLVQLVPSKTHQSPMFQELGVVAAPFGTAEPATLTIYNQPSAAPAIPSKSGSPPSLAPPSAIFLASQVP